METRTSSPAWARWAAAAMFVAGCAVASLVALQPDLAPPGQGQADKLLHVAAFAVLAVMGGLALPSGRGSAGIVLLLLALGWGIEQAQAALPGREASLLDLVADGVGAALGLALVQALTALRQQRA